MIKAKIGAILCLLSGLIAAVIYFWIDIKIAPSLVLLENIRFCRIYYPVLVALDLVLLMYLFLKAYALTGATETRQGVFSRLVASRPLEAVLMEAYAALNIFLAIRLHEYVRMDIYVPMMLAKSIFFTVLYQVQAIFAFIKQKKWMLLISLCGIVVLAAAVYAGLNWFLRDNPLNDAPKYLNILINGILSNVGKSWPESNYWITAAAIVGVECILPVIRLVGLSLYNTKNKIR